MPLARLAPQLSFRKLYLLLCVCVLTALLLPHAAAAQSGRKVKGAPPPSDPVRPDKPAPRNSTIVVCGHDTSRDGKEIYSTNVSLTVKAITDALNERHDPLMGVLNGGKQTRLEAVARAMSETGAYVLWFGYSTKMVGLYNETVEYIDYVVYKPQTGMVLVEGRVYPGVQKPYADPRGIMRLPRVRTRPNVSQQLKDGGREIANLVRNKL